MYRGVNIITYISKTLLIEIQKPVILHMQFECALKFWWASLWTYRLTKNKTKSRKPVPLPMLRTLVLPISLPFVRLLHDDVIVVNDMEAYGIKN